MNPTGVHSPLRPLGLGEVLDRAVTLCVKFFLPFATIYLVYAIPLAVLTFFATKDLQTVFQSLADLMQRGAATGRPASQAQLMHLFLREGGLNPWSSALIAVTLLISPLPTAALIDATASTYLGRLPTFAQAYETGLARWLPLIGVNALYVVSGLVAYVAVGLVLLFVVFALTFLTINVHALGIALDIVFLVGFFVSVTMFAVVVTLALQVSYFTCVVERATPATAFTKGLSRVFRGVGLKRSLLVGLAYVAIAIAITAVALAGQAVLVGLLHSSVAGTVYSTLVRIATAAFTTAFVAIFYFDLRVREEGLDLSLEAQGARAEIAPAT